MFAGSTFLGGVCNIFMVGIIMIQGHFYYIDEQYFLRFPDDTLMRNKEMVGGKPHDRPCFFAFLDDETGLYWMIPISSQVEKYKRHYDAKIKKYGRCDTIVFGKVLGYTKAFLIQNMCPVVPRYVAQEYINSKTSIPVRVDAKTEKELIVKAKRVLLLEHQGHHIVFPNIKQIEEALLSDSTRLSIS